METMRNYFSLKELEFFWADVMHETNISLTLPDLSNARLSIGGDWGPSYTFKLPKKSAIRIRYNETEDIIPVNKIEFDSPMLASVRLNYPLKMSISNNNRDQRILLYFSDSYALRMVEIFRNSDNILLYRSYLSGEAVAHIPKKAHPFTVQNAQTFQ